MVLDFVKALPEFLTYIVPGYIFLAVFQYILYKDQDFKTQTTSVVLSSLVISFIIKSGYDAVLYNLPNVSLTIGSQGYLIWICVLSSILGFVIAKLVSCEHLGFVCDVLHIDRTIHENIWNDVMKPDLWVRVWLRDSNKSYYGKVRYHENHGREPIIVLEYYQFLGDDAQVIVDNTNDPKRSVMLNLSQFERIELAEN